MQAELIQIKRLPPYAFEQVDRLKAATRAEGIDVIDFGMGNPDLPAPRHVVEKMLEVSADLRASRYSVSKGIAGLRRAQARYYSRRFNVKLNADSEVVVTLGSKDGFANTARAITGPGDVVLAPDPSYPIHAFGFLMAGGVIRSIPATPDDSFLRALDRALRHSVPKPIALVLNFPSNPTGHSATLDFYRDVVAFARRHEIVILSDLAYAEIYFDGIEPPPSVLQVPGAIDVAVEFTSLSKTYSMPGWRVGFAVGNARLLTALSRVKSYLDYGAFVPIQVAAIAALDGSDACIRHARETYRRRRDVLVKSFSLAGWVLPRPTSTMFIWTRIPEKFAHLRSLEFAKLLMRKCGIAVAPGVGFGENGEGYVRLALCENQDRIRQAARRIKKLLSVDSRPTRAGRSVAPSLHARSLSKVLCSSV